MIARRATLRINHSEYDILRFRYTFQRDIDAKGRPCSVYYGGTIFVELESSEDVQLFQHMVHKKMLPVCGSIEVLSGADEICFRRIAFEHAYVAAYGESMRYGSLPPTTVLAISPMRLDFDDHSLRLDRRWPQAPDGWQKYEEEEVTYAKSATGYNDQIVEAYWIDSEGKGGKKGEKRKDLLTNYPVKLYIVLEDFTVGKEVTFHFEDARSDGWYTADCSGVINGSGIVEIEDFQLKLKE